MKTIRYSIRYSIILLLIPTLYIWTACHQDQFLSRIDRTVDTNIPPVTPTSSNNNNNNIDLAVTEEEEHPVEVESEGTAPGEQILDVQLLPEESIWLPLVGCERERTDSIEINSNIRPIFNTKYTPVCLDSHIETEQKKVDIIFALDRTSSMGNNIEIIRSNLLGPNGFIEIISEYSPRVGVVIFDDEIVDVMSLTANEQTIFDTLNTYTYSSGLGRDTGEAGLLAIEKAVEMFEEDMLLNDSRLDAHKIVVLVTDSPNHDGSGPDGNRNFSIDMTVSKINNFINNYSSDEFFMYPSVPNETDLSASGCSIFKDVRNLPENYHCIRNQVQDLIDNTNLNRAVEQRGKFLDFPFSSSILNSELVSYIMEQRTYDHKCIVKEGELLAGDIQVPLDVSLETSMNNLDIEELDANIELSPSQIDNIVDNNLTVQLKLTRCCDNDENLQSGMCSFNEYTQTINWNIVITDQ